MKEIQLTQGKVALVDDEDFEYLNQWKWYAHNHHGKFYATRSIRINGKKKTVRMHRVIVNNTNPKMHTDHQNGDSLDNRRMNLRICTASENCRNTKKYIHNTSGYKGVTWNKAVKKWVARIELNKKRNHLGYFIDIKDAAHAYNEAAIKFHGAFAKLNEI